MPWQVRVQLDGEEAFVHTLKVEVGVTAAALGSRSSYLPDEAIPASPPPPALSTYANCTCLETCEVNGYSAASDGFCDDGGPGSEYSMCRLGSDCHDCGPRGGPSELFEWPYQTFETEVRHRPNRWHDVLCVRADAACSQRVASVLVAT